jgi:hypothetical protein
MARQTKVEQLKAVITRLGFAAESPATKQNLEVGQRCLELLTATTPPPPAEVAKAIHAVGHLPYAGMITIDLQNAAKPALEKLLDSSDPAAGGKV